MHKKYLIIVFYSLFVSLASLSLIFIPNALNYSGGSVLSLCILSAPLFYFLYLKFGLKVFLKLFFSLALFASIIEYIGLVTGWPYGNFLYGGHLGYKILGVLPWTVGLSWTPLVIGVVALVYTNTQSKILRILLPVILLLTFDLLLDPVAVHLGMWSYLHGGIYYNVPVQNFCGWIFSGLVGTVICYFYLYKYPNKTIYQLSFSFFMSIVFWTIVAFGYGLTTPAVCGLGLITYCVMTYYKKSHC